MASEDLTTSGYGGDMASPFSCSSSPSPSTPIEEEEIKPPSLNSIMKEILHARVFTHVPPEKALYEVLKCKKIAIEGPIGVGKTTFGEQARDICKKNGIFADYYAESAPEASLVLFYQNQSKYAHFLQTKMASSCQKRFAIATMKAESTGSPQFLDRSLPGNAAFHALHVSSGRIDKREHDAYMIDLKEDGPYDYHVLVYFRCNIDTLLERIKQRGRPSEQGLPREYLVALDKAYMMYILGQLEMGAKNIILVDWNTFGDTDAILRRVIYNIIGIAPTPDYSGGIEWLENSTDEERDKAFYELTTNNKYRRN